MFSKFMGRFNQSGASEKINYVDLLPTPVVAIDREFTITYITPAGAGVVGKTPEQVIGMKCHDIFKTSHCGTSECRCRRDVLNGRRAFLTGRAALGIRGLFQD